MRHEEDRRVPDPLIAQQPGRFESPAVDHLDLDALRSSQTFRSSGTGLVEHLLRSMARSHPEWGRRIPLPELERELLLRSTHLEREPLVHGFIDLCDRVAEEIDTPVVLGGGPSGELRMRGIFRMTRPGLVDEKILHHRMLRLRAQEVAQDDPDFLFDQPAMDELARRTLGNLTNPNVGGIWRTIVSALQLVSLQELVNARPNASTWTITGSLSRILGGNRVAEDGSEVAGGPTPTEIALQARVLGDPRIDAITSAQRNALLRLAQELGATEGDHVRLNTADVYDAISRMTHGYVQRPARRPNGRTAPGLNATHAYDCVTGLEKLPVGHELIGDKPIAMETTVASSATRVTAVQQMATIDPRPHTLLSTVVAIARDQIVTEPLRRRAATDLVSNATELGSDWGKVVVSDDDVEQAVELARGAGRSSAHWRSLIDSVKGNEMGHVDPDRRSELDVEPAPESAALETGTPTVDDHEGREGPDGHEPPAARPDAPPPQPVTPQGGRGGSAPTPDTEQRLPVAPDLSARPGSSTGAQQRVPGADGRDQTVRQHTNSPPAVGNQSRIRTPPRAIRPQPAPLNAPSTSPSTSQPSGGDARALDSSVKDGERSESKRPDSAGGENEVAPLRAPPVTPAAPRARVPSRSGPALHL